jgi:hypothetical protein
MFIEMFSGFILTGVPLAGASCEWISIEMKPQRGARWEAGTPASDILFCDPLMRHLLGGRDPSRVTVKPPSNPPNNPPNNSPNNPPNPPSKPTEQTPVQSLEQRRVRPLVQPTE